MRKIPVRAIALLCSSLALVGCGPGKVQQCQEAIALAGAANARARELAAPPEPEPEQMLQAATELETAATDLEALSLRDPELATWQRDYTETYRTLAAATREFVAAKERRDREAAEAARDRLEAAHRTEVALVQSINSYCLGDGT